MANLKDLRNRISSVKATQKITSAMKMVAAAKLRKAQDQVESARPYAEKMQKMVSAIADNITSPEVFPPMLVGREKDNTHLIIIASSIRGLCGGFNASIIKAAKELWIWICHSLLIVWLLWDALLPTCWIQQCETRWKISNGT